MTRSCRNGHPLTPENIYRGSDGYERCKACRQAGRSRYEVSANGRARHREARARYEATTAGWERRRRYKLKGAREAIQAQLEALQREEDAWRTSLAKATQKKS